MLDFKISFLFLFSSIIFAQTSPHGKIKIDCFKCHTTNSWNEIKTENGFNHSETEFVLVGVHANQNCKKCHLNLNFTNTSRECIACHLNDYNNTTYINHRSNKFQTDCKICHSDKINSWKNSFDHGKTEFRLEGAHIATPCISCHKSDFRSIKIECFNCHEKDYLATKDPNHKNAGFMETCLDCHRPVTWQPATNFAHERFFPIANGDKHSPGVWNSCKDCHNDYNSFKNFECINCHEHEKNSMDKEHDEVSGYAYQSLRCYSCHPQGEAD